jgi:hypothetical protein
MKVGLIITAGVVGLLVLLFVIRMIALHFVAKKGDDALADHYKSEEIVRSDTQADGRGLLSAGTAPRGNGALALTKTELGWFPISGSETHIPIAKVTGVDIVNNHNGYSGRPLLQVHFKTDAGADDAWAWLVREPEAWKADIAKLRGAP